jgi:MATE family multidrug resistance protein
MTQAQALASLADRFAAAGASPRREVLLLSLPISLTLAGQVIMAFVNNYMVARELGTAATAAVVIPGLVAIAVTTLLGGVSSAVAHFAARCVGRGDPGSAGGYVWQGLYVSALTLPIAAALASVAGPAFAAINRPGEGDLAALQTEYFRIRVFGCVTAVGTMAVAAFFQGVGRPMVMLAPMLTSNLVNLIGNWLLIGGNLGCPRWELTGAAAATVFGSVFQFCWLAGLLLTGPFARDFATRRPPAPDAARLAELARVGLPTTAEKFVEFTGWGLFLAVIGYRFGKADLAAGTITLQWMSLSFMPVVGIALAVSGIVGRHLGRGRPDDAEVRVWTGLRMGMAYMTVMGAVFLLLGRELTGVFSADPEVIATGARVLVCAAVFQWINPVMLVFAGALRGAGDTAGVARIMWVFNHGLFVPAAAATAFLAPGWGSVGPWAVGSVYVVAISAAYWLRFRTGAWRTMRLMGAEAEPAPGAPPPSPEPRPAAAPPGSSG